MHTTTLIHPPRRPLAPPHYILSAQAKMDQLKSNIANAQDEFNDQKSTLRDQAELGETAATIAAKAPVSPETVIEGVMFWRKASE